MRYREGLAAKLRHTTQLRTGSTHRGPCAIPSPPLRRRSRCRRSRCRRVATPLAARSPPRAGVSAAWAWRPSSTGTGLGADPTGPAWAAGWLVVSFRASTALGRLALAADVDSPAGQAVGQACVLPLLADRQRQ